MVAAGRGGDGGGTGGKGDWQMPAGCSIASCRARPNRARARASLSFFADACANARAGPGRAGRKGGPERNYT